MIETSNWRTLYECVSPILVNHILHYHIQLCSFAPKVVWILSMSLPNSFSLTACELHFVFKHYNETFFTNCFTKLSATNFRGAYLNGLCSSITNKVHWFLRNLFPRLFGMSLTYIFFIYVKVHKSNWFSTGFYHM